VGLKLDLNQATEQELTLLPGVGPSLARSLVRGREEKPGGYRSWDEVDAVGGVGPSKLEVLQAAAEIR
jgi:competence protein ComEA